jgi:hypothetical protein
MENFVNYEEPFMNYFEADKINCKTETDDSNLVEVINGGNYICRQRCEQLGDCSYVSQNENTCKLFRTCDKFSNCETVTVELPANNDVRFWKYTQGYYTSRNPLNIPSYFKIMIIQSINNSTTEFTGTILEGNKVQIKKRNNDGWRSPINIELHICSARSNGFKTYCKSGIGNRCEDLLLDEMEQQYTPIRNRDASGNMIDITTTHNTNPFGVDIPSGQITDRLGEYTSFINRI